MTRCHRPPDKTIHLFLTFHLLMSTNFNMSRRTNYHYDEVDEDDEDESVSRLHSKVRLLKTVSIQIGEETREHNKFLRQVDSNMDSTWGSLSLNMERVKKLARAGHNRIVFYLLAFALFVMIVIYMISKRL